MVYKKEYYTEKAKERLYKEIKCPVCGMTVKQSNLTAHKNKSIQHKIAQQLNDSNIDMTIVRNAIRNI